MKENQKITEYRNLILEKINMNENLDNIVFSVNDIEMGVLEFTVFLEDDVSVKRLLEHGLDPNGKHSLDNISPLMIATEVKNINIINTLIKYRADINQCDEIGITPLMIATRNNDIEAIKSLVIAGADIYKSDFYGQSAITIAGSSDNHDVFDFYTKIMLKNDNFTFQYDNIFFSAISSKNMIFVKKFIEINEIKNIKNNQGKTPLHIAVESDYLEVVPLLLSKNVPINIKDNNGSTVYDLSYQCLYLNEKRQKVFKKLIDKYASINNKIELNEPVSINSISEKTKYIKRKLH